MVMMMMVMTIKFCLLFKSQIDLLIQKVLLCIIILLDVLIHQVCHVPFTFDNFHELSIVFEAGVGVFDQAFFVKLVIRIKYFEKEKFLYRIELLEGHKTDLHPNFHNEVLFPQVLD